MPPIDCEYLTATLAELLNLMTAMVEPCGELAGLWRTH